MTDNTATPARGSKRTQDAVRGRATGRLTVGDYVGQLASEAAQAIRCAGLRPGLERSYGCEPELHARVVVQEPPAGSDLARNGMVTLYVGTTGAGPADEEQEALESERDDRPPSETALPQTVTHEVDAGQDPPPRPEPVGDLEAAPAPIPVEHEVDTEPHEVRSDDDLSEAWDWSDCAEEPAGSDGEEHPGQGAEPLGADEPPHEQAVSDADDLFARRAGPGLAPWRSVYPRRSVHGTRTWQRRLLAAALALLALWGAVTVGELAGKSASRTPPRARALVAPRTATPPRAHASTSHRRVRAEPTPRRHLRAPRAIAPVARKAAAPAAPPAPPPQDSEGASARPAPASTPPPPAPEQTGGGPFSP